MASDISAANTHARSVVDDISYVDLYSRWEAGNWSAMEIDFTQDKIDWETKLTDEQRRSALWFYTLFFHGEDAVTDGLSPYLDAAPLEEQKYFIATQQVDEARHSVFFKRFMEEVVGLGDGSIAGGMLATDELLTWGHRQVFQYLDRMCDRLRKDQSPKQLAAAVTLYHVIIEGTLAQPGQHFMEEYLNELDVLPGFRQGIRNVALDEQRHIAFGVKLLHDLYTIDPVSTQEAIVETIREVGPYTAAIAKPPDWDETYFTCFGFTYEQLNIEGARSLEMRLKAIGLDLPAIPRFPIPMDLPLEDRASRGTKLLRANLIGPDTPVSHDSEAIGIMFDSMIREAKVDYLKQPITIGWEFSDAAPWTISLDPDSGSRTYNKLLPHTDLRFRCTLDDWADVFAGRADMRRSLLTRKIRPKGDLRVLLQMGSIF